MNFKYYLVYILIFVVIEIKAQFYQTLNTSIKPTYSEINENGDIILVQSTSFDSVEILNSVLKPLSNPRPILEDQRKYILLELILISKSLIIFIFIAKRNQYHWILFI